MVASRIENAKRNIVFGAINRILSLIIPFVSRTVIIQHLGEEYLGLNSLFSSILQVLSITELGFSSAIAASMYKPIAEGDTIKVSALLNLYKRIYKFIGISIIVFAAGVIPFLPNLINGTPPDGVNIYVLFVLYVLGTSFSYLLYAYDITLISTHQRSDITDKVGSTTKLLTGILQIISITVFKSILTYVVLNLICVIAYNIICHIVSRKMYPHYACTGKISKIEQKKITKDIFALAISKFGNTISVSLDTIVISSFIGLNMVAVYGNYNYVVSSIVTFISLIFGSVVAGIGNSIVLESKEKNYRNFCDISFLNSWIIGWCSCCLLCLSQRFMTLWLDDASMLLPIGVLISIVLCFYINQLRLTTQTYKNAAGLWWPDRFRPLIGCALNLILNIYLVQKIGVAGVVISTIVSYLFVELPWETRVLFKHYFGISPSGYFGDIFSMFVKWVATIAITYFLCLNIPQGIFGFIYSCLICLIIPNAVMALLNYQKMGILLGYASKKFKQ